ncbi:hypothetical protein [Bacillus sp. FSL K6-3431]|uniref:hypothetical protein n=1 Tax=Bacillus sp. FSL K6-3431 TaxID=2921500 RepID=UPI0030FCB5ED
MMEKAIASGIKANATTIPARTSDLTFENHSFLIFLPLCSTPHLYDIFWLLTLIKAQHDLSKISLSLKAPKWNHFGA